MSMYVQLTKWKRYYCFTKEKSFSLTVRKDHYVPMKVLMKFIKKLFLRDIHFWDSRTNKEHKVKLLFNDAIQWCCWSFFTIFSGRLIVFLNVIFYFVESNNLVNFWKKRFLQIWSFKAIKVGERGIMLML